MAVLRLDYVQPAMPAGGEAQAIEFYERLLGIQAVPKPPHLAQREDCWFEDVDVTVRLGVDAAFQLVQYRPRVLEHPPLGTSG